MKKITCTAEKLSTMTFDNEPCQIKLIGNVGNVRLRTIFEKHKTINKISSLELDMSELCIGRFSYESFANITSLTKVKLPDSMDFIDGRCFKACVRLNTVDIPFSVRKISSEAFDFCVSLEKVYIHDKIDFDLEGNEAAFYNSDKITFVLAKDCPSIPVTLLKSKKYLLEVEKGNPYFYVKGDFVLSDDRKKLLFFNVNSLEENIVIPNGVEEIGDYCFYNNHRVKTVLISRSVTKIGKCAFEASDVKILTEEESLAPEALMCFRKDIYISKDLDVDNPKKNSLNIIRKNKKMKNPEFFDFAKNRKEIAKTINEMPFHVAQYLFYAETYDKELFIDYPFVSDILDSFEAFKKDRLQTKRNVVNARNIIQKRRKGGKQYV